MNRFKTGVAAAVLALTIAGPTAGAAFGGEVTGKGKPTPAGERARSVCAFSGKEDGTALIGFINGVPQFITVATGPGLVQNPHQENAAGIIHEPGIPGTACRGNGGGEG